MANLPTEAKLVPVFWSRDAPGGSVNAYGLKVSADNALYFQSELLHSRSFYCNEDVSSLFVLRLHGGCGSVKTCLMFAVCTLPVHPLIAFVTLNSLRLYYQILKSQNYEISLIRILSINIYLTPLLHRFSH